MRNKNRAIWVCVAIAVGALAGRPAQADNDALAKRQIEVEAQFKESDGGTTKVLSVPKVMTMAGQAATIKVVTELPCPNGEFVEVGIILCVTPTIEGDTVILKGSAHIVTVVQPDKKQIHKSVEWVGFKEVKTCFAVTVEDQDERYRLGPIQVDGKQIVVWLKARRIPAAEAVTR